MRNGEKVKLITNGFHVEPGSWVDAWKDDGEFTGAGRIVGVVLSMEQFLLDPVGPVPGEASAQPEADQDEDNSGNTETAHLSPGRVQAAVDDEHGQQGPSPVQEELPQEVHRLAQHHRVAALVEDVHTCTKRETFNVSSEKNIQETASWNLLTENWASLIDYFERSADSQRASFNPGCGTRVGTIKKEFLFLSVRHMYFHEVLVPPSGIMTEFWLWPQLHHGDSSCWLEWISVLGWQGKHFTRLASVATLKRTHKCTCTRAQKRSKINQSVFVYFFASFCLENIKEVPETCKTESKTERQTRKVLSGWGAWLTGLRKKNQNSDLESTIRNLSGDKEKEWNIFTNQRVVEFLHEDGTGEIQRVGDDEEEKVEPGALLDDSGREERDERHQVKDDADGEFRHAQNKPVLQ